MRDRTCLELGGLNLLVGANSAGKSSVLHSLLLASQTLANPLADRPLVLNGRNVRLGLAEDTVHEASNQAISLGFSLRAVKTGSGAGARQPPGFSRLDVDADFAMTSEGTDFALERVMLEAHDQERALTLDMAKRTQTATERALRDAGLRGNVVKDLARAFDMFSVHGNVPDRTAGARMSQFLPEDTLFVGNAYEDELEGLRWPFLSYRYEVDSAERERARQQVVSRPVLEFLRRYLEEQFADEGFADDIPRRGAVTVDDLFTRLPSAPWQSIQDVAATRWYLTHRESLPFKGAIRVLPLAEPIRAGVEFARRWFGTHVQHLGPLRAPPQPLYNLPEAASGTSVGRDGEYTAAVLSRHARRMVLSPDPNSGSARLAPLSRAVDEWMAEMQLLSSISSQERGKLGFELHLSVDGVKRDLDLTTVGVGVSQALPVVVLGLLSPPGSLLLFEQPELHLHPDVQAALGDFFLALARSGRQVLVETHSEYLVNRLRRRTVTDPNARASELVRLFFFERSGSTSKVRRSEIGPGGSISDWPAGFLDTAARELEAIALARRRLN